MLLSSLRDYVDVQLTPARLAERLTLLGMEVKDFERWVPTGRTSWSASSWLSEAPERRSALARRA